MLPEPLQAFLSTGIQVVFAVLPAAPLIGKKGIVARAANQAAGLPPASGTTKVVP
jgi:hypothetical protein